jgi:SagB-type dehydrogenase family enzyme
VLDKPQRMKFQNPREDASVSLERCIRQRRSVRSFRARGLATDDLGQLLWATQGIAGADERRSVPSAGALYPLTLYAVIGQGSLMTPGVYRYFPAIHEMVLVAPGFQREKLGAATRAQGWIATAAAIMCIAAAFPRTTAKYGARGRGYVYMEAGHAAQSLMLQAVALGLGAAMVGAFDEDAALSAAGRDAWKLIPRNSSRSERAKK